MNLRSFKVNRAFGPAQYVKMQATFPEVEFLTILFRFKKRKQNSSSYVPEVSRQSRAVDVKEMYEKAWCTCRAVVLIIKPIVFWSGRCRSCLSSLLFSAPNPNLHDTQVNLHQPTFPRPG